LLPDVKTAAESLLHNPNAENANYCLLRPAKTSDLHNFCFEVQNYHSLITQILQANLSKMHF